MDPVQREELIVPEGTTLVVFAENQPPYQPLPVIKFPDGIVYSEWQPTEDELLKLIEGGKIRVRLWQWTFNTPLQPVRLELI